MKTGILYRFNQFSKCIFANSLLCIRYFCELFSLTFIYLWCNFFILIHYNKKLKVIYKKIAHFKEWFQIHNFSNIYQLE